MSNFIELSQKHHWVLQGIDSHLEVELMREFHDREELQAEVAKLHQHGKGSASMAAIHIMRTIQAEMLTINKDGVLLSPAGDYYDKPF